MRFFITIDGTTLGLFENDIEISNNDISTSDSGRSNVTGIMNRKIVHKVWNIKLSFRMLNESKVQEITNLIKGNDNLTVSFACPATGYSQVTESFYAGDVTYKVKQLGEHIYTDMSVELHMN